MVDQSYMTRNEASRERLQLLVARLTEADLSRTVREGWTVAALLAHVAFWDRLRMLSWERTEPEQSYIVSDVEEDLVNDASLPQWRALPPNEAVRDALAAAEQIDAKIKNLSPEVVARYREKTGGQVPWMLDRSIHRHRHLDEIEQALGIRTSAKA